MDGFADPEPGDGDKHAKGERHLTISGNKDEGQDAHGETKEPEPKLRALGRLNYCEGFFRDKRKYASHRECEAIALHAAGDKLLLAWATRGNEVRDSLVAWRRVSYEELIRPGQCLSNTPGKFPSNTMKPLRFSAFAAEILNHPMHKAAHEALEKKGKTKRYIRYVSDMAFDAKGNLFVTAAYDPRDEGPFSTALFQIGRFDSAGNGKIAWAPDFGRLDHRPLAAEACRKYEALALSGDGRNFVLGSDDEDFGGCLRFLENSISYGENVR